MADDLTTAASETLERFTAAWNVGDADALAALFEDEASFINIAAGQGVGRARIAAMHAAGFSGPLKDTEIAFPSFDVRLLSPTVALLTAAWVVQTHPADDEVSQARSGLLSLVLRHSEDMWRATAGHNTQTGSLPSSPAGHDRSDRRSADTVVPGGTAAPASDVETGTQQRSDRLHFAGTVVRRAIRTVATWGSLAAVAFPIGASAEEAKLTVSVPGVQAGARIPDEFAFCRADTAGHVTSGQDLSLPVEWQTGPEGTRSYAVSLTDPDVPQDISVVNKKGTTIPVSAPRGVFYHWMLADIPADRHELRKGEDSTGVVQHGKPAGPAEAGWRGVNDYTGFLASSPQMSGTYAGYDGPCPPWNDLAVHHYTLTVYALDEPKLKLADPFDGKAFVAALQGHVLAQGSVTMTYTTHP